MVVGWIALVLGTLPGLGSWLLFRGWNPHNSRDRVWFMAGMTAASLFLPTPFLFILLAGLLWAPRSIWWFTASTFAINTLLLGLLTGTATASLGWLDWSHEGAWLGVVGAARISSILIWNFVALRNAGHGWFLDALQLPTKPALYVGAIWLATVGIQEDFQRLKATMEMEGTWKTGKDRFKAIASMLPLLLFRSHERAIIRRDALWLAGHPTPTWFAPFVAITALAAAGRLAFIAIPNVALTYVFVFVGGLLYGPRVASFAAAAAMMGTNVFLSGFAPQSFVNAPAMMLIGLLGGWMRGLDFSKANGKALAASTGFFATLAFSIVADALSWAIIPEFRGSIELLQVRVAAGLAFNVLPAVANGILFAAVCGPCQKANHQT